MQYSVAVNNARLDAVETTIGASPKLRIFSGSMPANCAAADSGTLLVEMTLPADWLNAAASAAKTLLGTWSGTASGGSAATPTHYRIWNNAGTACGMQGSAGIGSGELQVNGTITSGQAVSVSSFTINAANT